LTKKNYKHALRFLYIFLGFLFSTSNAQQNFSLTFPIDSAQWQIGGAAQVIDLDGINGNDEVQLVGPNLFESGFLFFNNPVNLNVCRAWQVDFDFRIWSTTSVSGADGFAFAFLEQFPSGFVSGGGLGIPNASNTRGVIVGFDTFDNCHDRLSNQHDNPEIQVREIDVANGLSYDENCATPTRQSTPTTAKLGTGNLATDNFILRSTNYRHARIVFENQQISVFVDVQNNGTLQQVIAPVTLTRSLDFSGFFGFTAATGSWVDSHAVKNVNISINRQDFEFETSAFLCDSNPITLDAGNGFDTYEWTDALGNTIGNTRLLTVDTLGVFTATKTSLCGVETEHISVVPNDITIRGFTEIPFCGIKEITLDVAGGLPPYSYSLDGFVTSQDSPVFQITETNLYTFSVRDALGCVRTRNIPVVLPANLTTRLRAVSANQIEAFVSGGTPPFMFSFNGAEATTSNRLTITQSGTYTVTVTDALGCVAEASLFFSCDPLVVPNFFSPNGDGINDFWFPSGLSCTPDIKVTIYDRSGRVIARFRGAVRGWDGKFNGQDMPGTDYWYEINTGIGDRPIVGHFNLFR